MNATARLRSALHYEGGKWHFRDKSVVHAADVMEVADNAEIAFEMLERLVKLSREFADGVDHATTITCWDLMDDLWRAEEEALAFIARHRDAQWDGNPKGEDPEGLRAKHDSPVGEADAPTPSGETP